ncbi:ParB/RepB/Spo0J family partition protein [Nocardioides solisilvae]|uniref:ParB/RepB/Spo0J family partition protein n=1 Tax=Nocardioides solisilvae TaxID=1542435 RepID=UPI000D749E46|nr:ParB/RepB/Spo0J family partition protein [Nocardioides solisilvae]
MSSTPRPPRRGLGRGLGALIPTAPSEAAGVSGDSHAVDGPAAPAPERSDAAAVVPPGGVPGYSTGSGDPSPDVGSGPVPGPDESGVVTGAYFREIPIAEVRPNARQPRQVFEEEALAELVHSIREIGLLQPVVVRPSAEGGYELIMGERRWRASQEAGLEHIPAIVRETDDGDMLRDALLENLHRSQLNPLEEAAAYGQLLEDFGCTHEELAQRIGRSRPQISNTLRLLKLSPAVQRRVAAGVLSAGHARALLAVEDADLQDRLAQRVVAEGISVRALEEIVALGDHGKPARAARRSKPVAPGLVDLADRLSDRFETRVKVDLGKSKGKITVEFASMDDLRRIVDVMDPGNDQQE